MKCFFVQYNGDTCVSLQDLPNDPADEELALALNGLDGREDWATLVSALPDGVDWYTATRRQFDTVKDFIQVGGAADRLLVQIGRMKGEEHQMYNLSLHPTSAGAAKTERIEHGESGQHTMVRPEEVLTAQEALPILVHYVRNDQTLPPGLWLRDFNDSSAAFQER